MLMKNSIINYLSNHKKNFFEKYSIVSIGLFGSYAKNTNTINSDIDIIYKTSSKGLTFSQINQLEEELTAEFGRNIDLVNFDYMNPLIKRKALKDIIYI